MNLLQKYEDSFLQIDWKTMTDQEKLDLMHRWFELKIFDSKLNKAKIEISQEEQDAQSETRKAQTIEYLKTLGFACDNSVEDYYLIFNNPEVFGANWKERADYEHSMSNDINYFLNIIQNYL